MKDMYEDVRNSIIYLYNLEYVGSLPLVKSGYVGDVEREYCAISIDNGLISGEIGFSRESITNKDSVVDGISLDVINSSNRPIGNHFMHFFTDNIDKTIKDLVSGINEVKVFRDRYKFVKGINRSKTIDYILE